MATNAEVVTVIARGIINLLEPYTSEDGLSEAENHFAVLVAKNRSYGVPELDVWFSAMLQGLEVFRVKGQELAQGATSR